MEGDEHEGMWVAALIATRNEPALPVKDQAFTRFLVAPVRGLDIAKLTTNGSYGRRADRVVAGMNPQEPLCPRPDAVKVQGPSGEAAQAPEADRLQIQPAVEGGFGPAVNVAVNVPAPVQR